MNVLRDFGALDLTLPESAAQLANELGLMVPALHITLREHPAAGIAGQLAANLNPALLHKRATFALLAETETLQRRQQVDAEAVIGSEHVDILRRHAGHWIHLRRHIAMGRVIEILQSRPQLRGIDVLFRPAKAAHHDRLWAAILCHIRALHNNCYPPVIDEAVVEQP